LLRTIRLRLTKSILSGFVKYLTLDLNTFGDDLTEERETLSEKQETLKIFSCKELTCKRHKFAF